MFMDSLAKPGFQTENKTLLESNLNITWWSFLHGCGSKAIKGTFWEAHHLLSGFAGVPGWFEGF